MSKRSDRVLAIITEHPGLDAIKLREFGLVARDGSTLKELERAGVIVYQGGWYPVKKDKEKGGRMKRPIELSYQWRTEKLKEAWRATINVYGEADTFAHAYGQTKEEAERRASFIVEAVDALRTARAALHHFKLGGYDLTALKVIDRVLAKVDE